MPRHRVRRLLPPRPKRRLSAGRGTTATPATPAQGAFPVTLTVLVAAGLLMAWLVACSGSPAGSSSSSPPGPTASPLPDDLMLLSTPVKARQAITQYWKALAADDSERLRAVTTTALFDFTQGARSGVAGAAVRHIGKPVDPPPEGCNLEVPVDVYVWPDGQNTPWGNAGVHRVWMKLVGYDDGRWLVASAGTSP